MSLPLPPRSTSAPPPSKVSSPVPPALSVFRGAHPTTFTASNAHSDGRQGLASPVSGACFVALSHVFVCVGEQPHLKVSMGPTCHLAPRAYGPNMKSELSTAVEITLANVIVAPLLSVMTAHPNASVVTVTSLMLVAPNR